MCCTCIKKKWQDILGIVTCGGKKISEDLFSHKQLSEHAEITNTDNTEDLRKKPEAKKTTK